MFQNIRNPDRPAVAMPMAEKFNEKVAIDHQEEKHHHPTHNRHVVQTDHIGQDREEETTRCSRRDV